MPFLVEAVKNDSFPLPMTAGSENPDFLWSQFRREVKPVLWVPQSCLKVLWLGRNLRCPVSGNFWTKNHHTYDKSVFGDYLLISANDPSQKCVLPLLLHILIWTSTVV